MKNLDLKADTEIDNIIKKIMLEATKDGGVITEEELLAKLDKVPGFWEKAKKEDSGSILNDSTNH